MIKQYTAEAQLIVAVVFMALYPPEIGAGVFAVSLVGLIAYKMIDAMSSRAFKDYSDKFATLELMAKDLEKVKADSAKAKADVERLVLKGRA